jgi:hypothetical protein
MARIRILVSVAGDDIGSPSPGEIIEVPEEVAAKWADGERAVRIDEPREPERAVAPPPERRRRS